MTRQLPLTRSRLHEILARFDTGVILEMKGGYDTGCWFSFSGKLLGPLDRDDRIVGGRLIGRHGFCSEGIIQSREEQFSRGGSEHGISRFFARVKAREVQLGRWLAEYNAMTGDKD